MRVGSLAILAVALIAADPRASAAQQLPLGHGPAALSVPHPIPPPRSTMPVPPRDLYQDPMRPPMGYPIVVYPFVYSPPLSFGLTYGFTYVVADPAPQPAPAPGIGRGSLRFETSPGSAQVSIDGIYAGLIDDFGMSGRVLDLDEGHHRVELRATGYSPLNFDVSIAANQTTRYRGDLQQLSQPAPAAAVIPVPPARSRTTYVIPNCYAGDRPPSRALPSGCDMKDLRVFSR